MPMDYKRDSERRRIRERQEHEVEGNETYVMTRSADHSVWAKSAAWLERYKLLWYVLVGIGMALGFGFKTPNQYYRELNTRVDELSRTQATQIKQLDVLIKFQCLNQSDRDMSIAGIDCSKFVNPNLVRPR